MRRLPHLRSTTSRTAPGDDTAYHAAPFSARVVDDGGQVVVAVTGEIDLSTGEELWRAIEEATTRSRRLVIDLRETTFIDSSGLAVLVRAHQHLGQIKEAVVLRSPTPSARRVLDISGVDRLLTIEDDTHR